MLGKWATKRLSQIVLLDLIHKVFQKYCADLRQRQLIQLRNSMVSVFSETAFSGFELACIFIASHPYRARDKNAGRL
jgi:hypothetical protein